MRLRRTLGKNLLGYVQARCVNGNQCHLVFDGNDDDADDNDDDDEEDCCQTDFSAVSLVSPLSSSLSYGIIIHSQLCIGT